MRHPNRVLFVLLFLCLVTSSAFGATDPPSPDVDAAAWAKAIYTAMTSKEWGIVSGLALIGLVYLIRRFGPDLFRSKAGGMVLAGLISLAGTIGAALAAGAHVTLSLAIGALTTAATAAGVWEWLKAHIPGVQDAANQAAA